MYVYLYIYTRVCVYAYASVTEIYNAMAGHMHLYIHNNWPIPQRPGLQGSCCSTTSSARWDPVAAAPSTAVEEAETIPVSWPHDWEDTTRDPHNPKLSPKLRGRSSQDVTFFNDTLHPYTHIQGTKNQKASACMWGRKFIMYVWGQILSYHLCML